MISYDLSYRKEVKIRPGYTPEEDVQRYRSSHAAVNTGGKKGIPGMTSATSAPPPATIATSKSKAQKKNEKRKEKRRIEGKEDEEDGVSSEDEEEKKKEEEDVPESWDTDGEDNQVEDPIAANATAVIEEEEDPVVVIDPVDEARRIKALQKKLRQVSAISRLLI